MLPEQNMRLLKSFIAIKLVSVLMSVCLSIQTSIFVVQQFLILYELLLTYCYSTKNLRNHDLSVCLK